MLRCAVTIAAVAVLSALLGHWEHARGQRGAPAATAATDTVWVRTVDGWEPNTVLQASSSSAAPPALHPLLVAGFQLSASLLALLAFPGAVAGDGTARQAR